MSVGSMAGRGLLLGAVLGLAGLWGQAAAELTDGAKEEFLLRAEIRRVSGIGVGINATQRLTLSDGTVTHDAHWTTVDVRKNIHETAVGSEINFRDCYKFNIAAYRLDRLIGLNMVPVSVERRIEGKRGAVTWWVDDVAMMEKDRLRKRVRPPDGKAWNDQMFQARVFNELVYNTDANLGNLLITSDWKVRLIDFTRAFRVHRKLRNSKNLVRIDRGVCEGLRRLDEEALMRELKPVLGKAEIRGVLARRDKILERFDELIAEKGEAAVVCDLPGH